MRAVRNGDHLRWFRLEHIARRRLFVHHCWYLERADIVDNFALMRRDRVFQMGLGWDSDLKIGAEHMQFYIDSLETLRGSIFRTNALQVLNVRVQPKKFRVKRDRTPFFFSLFFRSGRVKSLSIIGERWRGMMEHRFSVHVNRNRIEIYSPPEKQ